MKRLLAFAYRCERRIKAWLHIRQRGVQALDFPPDGRLVLVALRYLAGWHLPGGGVRWRESAEAALLREMREETAMAGYTALRSLGVVEELSHGVRTRIEVFRIDGATCPDGRGWNLEILEIGFWPLAQPPPHCETARKRLAMIA